MAHCNSVSLTLLVLLVVYWLENWPSSVTQVVLVSLGVAKQHLVVPGLGMMLNVAVVVQGADEQQHLKNKNTENM